MADDLMLRQEDLVNNPTARIPVCLCLDVSGSMGGMPINELNEGVSLFYQAIKDDEIASYSAEICIVTFGEGGATCVADFASVNLRPNPPVLKASGMTPMGEGVNLALNRLECRKKEYKDAGVDYYQPWLVLMTDGAPNGSEYELSESIRKTVELINGRKLTIFPIGIGKDADMDVLASYSPNKPPLKLRGLNFKDFFEWLSKSVSTTSQSIPGERVQLDLEAIKGWGEL